MTVYRQTQFGRRGKLAMREAKKIEDLAPQNNTVLIIQSFVWKILWLLFRKYLEATFYCASMSGYALFKYP